MKDGDFIRIDYVGRIKENGEVFDVTREDVAKDNGIYNPNFKYGPVPVIIGSGFLIKGLEKELREMKVGDKKKIIVEAKDGFGKRSEKLIRLIPYSEFQKQNIEPIPGMPITMNNIPGRVISSSGGRVKVDFNHPLAGKELEYDVDVKSEIKGVDKKIKAVLEFFVKEDNPEIKVNDGSAEIYIKSDISRSTKQTVAETIKKWVNGIKNVRFIEEF
jgi:FKBP-type peptidyl-prolyl cis-trans isomerase 2